VAARRTCLTGTPFALLKEPAAGANEPCLVAPCLVDAPLLGDTLRRGCEAPSLRVRADKQLLRSALHSADAWYSVPIDDVGAAARAGAAGATPWRAAAAVVNAEEELAVRLGYAEHVEAEFFGAGGAGGGDDYFDDDEDEEEEELGGSGEPDGDFIAKMAQLRALQEDMGVGGE